MPVPVTTSDEIEPSGYRTGQARRIQILDAAERLIARHGLGAVSLRDIAAEVGISHVAVGRYFSSADALVSDLVDRHERASVLWWDSWDESGATRADALIDMAKRNAAKVGHVPFFTSLSGAATGVNHPDHAWFRRRYAERRVNTLDALQSADPTFAVELLAIWDGLQIQQCYRPDLDIAFHLWLHLDRVLPAAVRPSRPVDGSGLTQVEVESPLADTGSDTPGRKKRGQDRRGEIIAAAAAHFERDGYHATSVGELAKTVGVAKSTLIHHFGSKEALLMAVVKDRDQQLADRLGIDFDTHANTAILDRIIADLSETGGQRGSIALYTTLAAEAVAPTHPAHDYFRSRFELVRNFYAEVLAPPTDGSKHLASVEAALFVALWDGLQVQWLYDPDAVDIAAQLQRHLDGFERRVDGR